MTFGYLGYIWALIGCGGLAMVFGLSAAVLYGVSRRKSERALTPNIRVESLPLSTRPPDDAA